MKRGLLTSTLPMTMRPKSRSRLGLRSADPTDAVVFDSNMMGHEDDFDTLRRGVRLSREICQQAPLKELLGEEIWPGRSIGTVRSTAWPYYRRGWAVRESIQLTHYGS